MIDKHARRTLQKYRFHLNGWNYPQDRITQETDGTVSDPTPVPGGLTITSAMPLPDGEVGVVFTQYDFTATGGTTPYVWSLVSGGPLPGLTINAAGEMTGTPTQGGAGFSFVLRVTDDNGVNRQKTFSMNTVPPEVITASLPNTSGGQQYEETLVGASGVPPYTWDLASGALPPSLALSSDGVISGLVSVVGPAEFFFTVRISDDDSNVGYKDLSIEVV